MIAGVPLTCNTKLKASCAGINLKRHEILHCRSTGQAMRQTCVTIYEFRCSPVHLAVLQDLQVGSKIAHRHRLCRTPSGISVAAWLPDVNMPTSLRSQVQLEEVELPFGIFAENEMKSRSTPHSPNVSNSVSTNTKLVCFRRNEMENDGLI